MNNQLLTVKPYWHNETWVFDDPTFDLVKEPFILGVPEMINNLVNSIPDAQSGFRLIFSTKPFPHYQRKIEWVREEMEGNWYRSEEDDLEGWLCPALFNYFETAPLEIYVKAESL